jgi:hypothetical protein
MRMKSIRHWIAQHPSLGRAIVRIQARWRGMFARRRLALAGPGVLKRSLCHNDDEMVTMDSKADVHPHDYFAVEQDGRVWWFDQRTMLEWSQKDLVVRNPYTRTPLSGEDMRRLRTLGMIRKKRGMPLIHTQTPPTLTRIEIRDHRWMRVVQILYECGFTDILHHENFIAMSWAMLRAFLESLVEDTRDWMQEGAGPKDPFALRAKRAKYYTWLRTIHGMMGSYNDVVQLSSDVAGILLAAANDIADPTPLMFFVLSAHMRADNL